MKKFLILILILFPMFVQAESKDIIVKYKKLTNGITYIDKIENSTSKVIIGNKEIIVDVDSSLNGKNLALIKAKDDAYNWISSINGDGIYYYLAIIENDELIETNKIKSIKINGSLIKIYDANGNLVKSDKENVNYQNSNIYFTYEDIKEETPEEAELIINGKGRVIINEKIYESSQNIEITSNSKIMIMAVEDYEFKEAYLNDNSIYDKFTNNTYSYNLKKDDKLEITFAEKVGGSSEENQEYIDISGYVNKDDKPLQNVKIILTGSKEYTTTTDSNGYYEFNNIPFGEYEILIVSDDEKGIAYKKFSINKTGTGDVLTDGLETNVNIEVKDDYELSFDVIKNVDNELETEEKTSYLPIFIVGAVILILLLLIFLLLRKNKKEEKM